MAPSENQELTTTIATTLALIDQFHSSLSTTTEQITASLPESPSPLILLNAAATSLKSQVTKLSLLIITTPFTFSAVQKCLKSVNESILPSLTTATLLTTSELFASRFAAECTSHTKALLRDLQGLVRLCERRSQDKKPKKELNSTEKNAVTEATGRVWEDCDTLTQFASEGLAGFVVRKSRQWLDLMKDAVKELQDWDPEEEVDEDLFGDAISDEGSHEETDVEKESDSDRAAISAGVKDQALKVLSRIPQSIHVVIKQRLEKNPFSPEVPASVLKNKLDTVLQQTRTISELIDESAEGMYLGNLELCLKKAGEARALTIEVVEAVIKPRNDVKNIEPTPEDKYIQRALDWIRQVDTGAKIQGHVNINLKEDSEKRTVS